MARLLDDRVLMEQEALTVQRPDDSKTLQPSAGLPRQPLRPGVALPRRRGEAVAVQQRPVRGTPHDLHGCCPPVNPSHSCIVTAAAGAPPLAHPLQLSGLRARCVHHPFLNWR